MVDPAPSPDEVVGAIRDAIVRSVRPRRVILFGSHARGDARPDSDYDLLIVAEAWKPTWQLRVAARVAMMDIRVPMDLIVVTPEELREEVEWPSSVVATAVRTGRILYEAAQ